MNDQMDELIRDACGTCLLIGFSVGGIIGYIVKGVLG
jgi:hypothetical protein